MTLECNGVGFNSFSPCMAILCAKNIMFWGVKHVHRRPVEAIF